MITAAIGFIEAYFLEYVTALQGGTGDNIILTVIDKKVNSC
jgi:hypothetical protein